MNKVKQLIIIIFLTPLFYLTASAQFIHSYKSGTIDSNNKFMGGTEMRVLATHKGKLFGGTETWMDDTTGTCDPFIGAMIVRLDNQNANWQLDKHFNTFFDTLQGRERKRNEGITALESVIFTNDKNGVPLLKPDTILIAAARDFTGVLSVYTRNDTTGFWTETVVGTIPSSTTGSTDNDGTIRSFILYKDKNTGIDRIFAGSLPNGIISGSFDPSLPGKIAWNATAELSGFVGRPMAFTVCNGDLFCAIAPSIYKRTDGNFPSWSPVYTYPFNVYPGGSSGLRGLTTVKNPNGNGQSLLAALEGNPSKIFRLDVTATPPYNAVEEYNTLAEMTAAFGYPANYLVVANSEMTWVTEPTTGDSVLTITIQHHPALLNDDAFYLLRKQVGNTISYSLKNIDNKFFAPFTVLNSTRAIVNSPFNNDNNGLYIGGYDADNNVSHNTAYVLRTTKNTFFGIEPPQTQLAGLKRYTFQPSLTSAVIADSFFAHSAYINTTLTPKNKLVVFLAGSNSPNSAYENFLKTAANEGYHVLGLAYPNTPTVASVCADQNDSLCFDKVRNEIIDGIDRTILANVDVYNSIYNRLIKALQYLQSKYPNNNWGQYISGSLIQWNKLIMAGHSQGGGHAALIAKQNNVDKVLMFAAPKDYFTSSLNKPAAWINAPSVTDASKYYGFVHQNDGQGCTIAQQQEIYNRLGMATYGTPYDVFSGSPTYNSSHTLYSSISGLTSSNAHAIVVVDVLAANVCKTSVFADVWKYMLNSNPTALPVTFVFFNASLTQGSVLLNWKTANEINNDFFIVQHSTNNITWQNIGKVYAGNGNYNYLHPTPSVGSNYYRLQQVDKDGKASLSSIQLVNINTNQNRTIKVYPNPVEGSSIVLAFINTSNLNNTYTITDVVGKVLQTGKVTSAINTIQLSKMKAGTYFIKVDNGSFQKFIKK